VTEGTEGGALALLANEEGYDPIEDRLRAMVRQPLEARFEEARGAARALGRGRYARGGKGMGYRNGHRKRELAGTFGTGTVRIPRTRIEGEDGRARERRSKALPRYRRPTKKPDEESRGADRLGLPVWHEHAPGRVRPVRALQRGPSRRT